VSFMKLRICATVCALALAAAVPPAVAQTRPSNRTSQAPQASTQFDDHARQTTQTYYNQHKSSPPVGLRSQDRLSADQENRLQPGKRLDPDLQKRSHPVPRELSRQLPPPPPSHSYVAIGVHIGLVDNRDHTLRDVIHLHDQ
jgi:hypothetical protein